MGLGTQMVGWHEDFCLELAGRGFHVDALRQPRLGRSTHIEAAAADGRRELVPPRASEGRPTRSPTWPTTPSACSITSASSAAHIVGASMGGMIAQTLAIRHPERVRSLVSIMSNTGSR